MLICPFCENPYPNKMSLTMHLIKTHSKTYKDYVDIVKYNNNIPKCKCGCGNEPVFYRNDYKKWALGHDSFEHRVSMYKNIYGIPKCLNCGTEVAFIRAIPNTFCSHSCSQLYKIKHEMVNNLIGSEEYNKKISSKYGINIKNISQVIKPTFSNEEKARRSTWLKNNWIRVTSTQNTSFTSKFHKNMRIALNLNERGFVSEIRKWKYRVDEINETRKIIIEFMGDYWHCNPKLYKGNFIVWSSKGKPYSANDVWIRDKIKKEYLESLGYTIIELWESESIEEMEAKLKSYKI